MKGKGILIVFLALATAAGGFYAARHFERLRCADELAALAANHQSEVTSLKSAAERWVETVAKRQGEAVLRAFVAGITPSILAERRESLEISAVSLLRVPGIEGIHLFKPDGAVLYSSDAKLVTIGNAGEAGAWALAAPELISRTGGRQGTLEFAVPIVGTGRVLATVWMEFGLVSVRDNGRPAQWAQGSVAPEAPAAATAEVAQEKAAEPAAAPAEEVDDPAAEGSDG